MPHREELIKLTLEKAEQALKSAQDNINNKNFETAQNRIYYAIFYSVLALGYKNDFITSKHKQLMGWFNKKFIYEAKIFDEKMLEIYKIAFSNRLKSDYEIIFFTNKEDIEYSLNEAVYFVNEIRKTI
jgi:uncharacterized protein (UPF0332 family)